MVSCKVVFLLCQIIILLDLSVVLLCQFIILLVWFVMWSYYFLFFWFNTSSCLVILYIDFFNVALSSIDSLI